MSSGSNQTHKPQQSAGPKQAVGPQQVLHDVNQRNSWMFWVVVVVLALAFMMYNFKREMDLNIEKIQLMVERSNKDADRRISEVKQELSKRPESVESLLPEAVKLELLKRQARDDLLKVQLYAVDVTMDPGTAHPKLILSADGKEVSLGRVRKNLSDNPERFSDSVVVLGKQSFSSGRFYFEVQVKGKKNWDLGVAKESVNRKGKVRLYPENGYWTFVLRNPNVFLAPAITNVVLLLKCPPEKVGVFVDYEEGVVSFYDVGTAALIYSFTGFTFTERLYPYLSPSEESNSPPLIVTPVQH